MDLDFNVLQFWDSISFLPVNKSVTVIRVFVGGANSVQDKPFWSALKELKLLRNESYRIESMNVKDVKKQKWSPQDFVEWLLSSHLHFILSHIHQGLSQLGWHMDELYLQLMRLSYHPGFPTSSSLQCPIFQQDKFRYLNAVPELVNQTLQIFFTIDSELTAQVTNTLKKFMGNNHEGAGWVVKAPYTTNSEFFRIVRSLPEALSVLRTAHRQYYGFIPYMMVQPCMDNRKEYKIAIWNGESAYMCKIAQHNIGHIFSQHPHIELFKFAKQAIQLLAERCPYVICDGLVRVDVFKTKSGRLVVNEFESLEAAHYSSDAATEAKAFVFLQQYWFNKVQLILVDYANE